MRRGEPAILESEMKPPSVFILGGLLLLLASCGGGQGTSPPITPDQGVNIFGPAPLTWHSCPTAGYQCATLQVPLNYSRPFGPLISLALMRRPADNPHGRIGSIIIEPGGPGTTGADPIFYWR